MKFVLFGKKHYVLCLALLSIGNIFSMDQKQRTEQQRRADQQRDEQQRRAQQQRREQQQREEQQRRQEAIDRTARQELERTKAAKNVSISPSASQNLQFKATNHNVNAFHVQTMQSLNRKK